MSAILLHPNAHARRAPRAEDESLFGQLWATLAVWRERSRTRARLADLDDHMLRDIGLDPNLVEHEIRKPFWRV